MILLRINETQTCRLFPEDGRVSGSEGRPTLKLERGDIIDGFWLEVSEFYVGCLEQDSVIYLYFPKSAIKLSPLERLAYEGEDP